MKKVKGATIIFHPTCGGVGGFPRGTGYSECGKTEIAVRASARQIFQPTILHYNDIKRVLEEIILRAGFQQEEKMVPVANWI